MNLNWFNLDVFNIYPTNQHDWQSHDRAQSSKARVYVPTVAQFRVCWYLITLQKLGHGGERLEGHVLTEQAGERHDRSEPCDEDDVGGLVAVEEAVGETLAEVEESRC